MKAVATDSSALQGPEEAT